MTVEEKEFWRVHDKYTKALLRVEDRFRPLIKAVDEAITIDKCTHSRYNECSQATSNGYGKWFDQKYKQCRACRAVNFYGNWHKYCPRDYDD